MSKADAWREAHILLPWRARILIQVEHYAFKLNRWAEAQLWGMGLERLNRRSEKPSWRGQIVRRERR